MNIKLERLGQKLIKVLDILFKVCHNNVIKINSQKKGFDMAKMITGTAYFAFVTEPKSFSLSSDFAFIDTSKLES